MSFKDRLREKRLEANLTQVQLAEKVSVSARTIQNYESGTRKPTKYDVVEKIAAGFGYYSRVSSWAKWNACCRGA